MTNLISLLSHSKLIYSDRLVLNDIIHTKKNKIIFEFFLFFNIKYFFLNFNYRNIIKTKEEYIILYVGSKNKDMLICLHN